MIPLLYQLSYTGTNEDDSVKTPPCPDRPSSSRPVDDRNPRSVFQSFKNLLIPASCSLCPNAPESGKTGIFTGLIQLCRPCHEDFQIPTGNCPGCLHQGDPIASRCHLCRRRTLEKPLVHLGAHSGSLRRWILLAKHGNRSDLTRSLGRALSRQFVDSKLVEEISTKSFGVSPIVVSIPRNRFRALLKGQPLAKFLGEILATESNLAFRKLLRQKLSRPQSHKSALQRKTMPTDQFQIHEKFCNSGIRREVRPRVILVDDVLTTSTTLKKATRALEASGYRVAAWVTVSVTPVSR